MAQGDLKSRLEGLDAAQSVEVVKELVTSGRVSADDLEAIYREAHPSAAPLASVQDEEPLIIEHDMLAHRTVWVFTGYAITFLAIAGVIAYLIATHMK